MNTSLSRPCLPPPAGGNEPIVEVSRVPPVRVSFCPPAPPTAERSDSTGTIVPPAGVVS